MTGAGCAIVVLVIALAGFVFAWSDWVTSERPIAPRIADLVRFARRLEKRDIGQMTDVELTVVAESFWDEQHDEE